MKHALDITNLSEWFVNRYNGTVGLSYPAAAGGPARLAALSGT